MKRWTSFARVFPWVVVAATVALGVACLALALATARDFRFAGFLTYENGAVAPLSRTGWPGHAAGAEARRVVVAVDGHAVRGGPELSRRLAEVPVGAPVAIELRAPHGTLLTLRLPVTRLSPADLGYTLALPYSIGLLYLLLGALVFGLKRDLAGALTLGLCLLASALYLTMFDAHTAYRLTRIWHCFPMLGPISVHLFAVFPERRPAVARALVLAPLYLAGLAAVSLRQIALVDPVASDTAALVSSVMLAGEFLCDLGLLAAAARRGSSASVRNRAKTMLGGLALTMTLAIVWQFASRLGRPLLSADEAMIASATFPLLLAYALLRRNLFDVDAVLRATVVAALATALVLGVYFAGVAVLGALAAPLLGRITFGAFDPPAAGRVAAVLSTLAAAAAFHPLRLRVQRFVDRVLIGERQRPAEELMTLAAALAASGDLASLADEIVRRLPGLVGARGAALLLPGGPRGELQLLASADGEGRSSRRSVRPLGTALAAALDARPIAARELDPVAQAELDGLDAELVVPLRAGGRLAGVAVLAPRRAGRYGYADLRALERAGAAVALALEHARLLTERAAQERLAALGAMAAVVVHEVKNPLGIIKVSTGGLRKRAAPGDAASRELLGCVDSEVDRIDATCRRLLDLARPAAPELRPCDLRDVIRSTVDRLTPELAAAGVTVRCELDEAAPATVAADADALRQALVNLFYNARDSMGGGGELSVRLAARPGGHAIEVADTGGGMDEATRRQIFRPFFTTRHGGTGLGLAIVQRIVEDHRGQVQVESAPGAGARFTITLPAS